MPKSKPGYGSKEHISRLSRSKYTSHPESDGSTHHTWYDPQDKQQMSWDTDQNGDYKHSSGHDRPQGSYKDHKGQVNRWDK
jgi:hypothetical protein